MGVQPARKRGTLCARSCAVSIACALALVGCPAPISPPPTGDSGVPLPRYGSRAAGRVVVEISAGDDTLEDDVVLERLRLGVSEVRAENERGGTLEPSQRDVGTLDLTSGVPARIELMGAVPATYSAVSVTLAGEPALELRITEPEITYEVVTTGPILVDVRCELPVVLAPDGAVVIALTLDVGELHAALQEGALPEPEDGVVHVDATSAPAVIAEIEARVSEHWQVECGESVETSDPLGE